MNKFELILSHCRQELIGMKIRRTDAKFREANGYPKGLTATEIEQDAALENQMARELFNALKNEVQS